MRLVKVYMICDEESPNEPWLHEIWINRDNVSRVEGNGCYGGSCVIHFMTPLHGLDNFVDNEFELHAAGDPAVMVEYLNGEDHTNTPTWPDETEPANEYDSMVERLGSELRCKHERYLFDSCSQCLPNRDAAILPHERRTRYEMRASWIKGAS